ncbi:MAG: class I SAM-dependent methyltransferase [Solirubrobacteraceae bacterium]
MAAKLLCALRGAMRKLFTKTVRPVYRFARRFIVETVAERLAGIRTEGRIPPEELFEDSAHRSRYEPSGWLALRRILKRNEVSATDVFVDFGSGMGRVVFQAAWKYPFRRVIGVELSEPLNEIARRNIERNRSRLRCADVQIVQADVLDYDVPEDATVAYFNNPFLGPIFQAAVDKLVESLERAPRRMRVIYSNPIEEQMLLDAGFRQVRALRGMRPGADWSRSNSVRMYERA